MLAKLLTSRLTMHLLLGAWIFTCFVAGQYTVWALLPAMGLLIAAFEVHRISGNYRKIKSMLPEDVPDPVVRRSALQVPRGADLGGIVVEDKNTGERSAHVNEDLDLPAEARKRLSQALRNGERGVDASSHRTSSSGLRMRYRKVKLSGNDKKIRFVKRKPLD